jgi:uncharacterized protein YegL
MKNSSNNNQPRHGAPTVFQPAPRPGWACSNRHQAALLVRDNSGSMSGGKARDADAACRALVGLLAAPQNKGAFEAAVLDFDSGAHMVHSMGAASELGEVLSPLAADGGSTNLGSALQLALDELKRSSVIPDADGAGGSQQQDGISYLRPVVLVFTDGHSNTGPRPEPAAKRLKEHADLVTVAFGGDADEELLRGLATTPAHFCRCRNGGELRDFLAEVGKTMTRTLAAGQNATQALGELHKN